MPICSSTPPIWRFQNKQRGFPLVQVDKVGVIAPVGLFSKKGRFMRLDEIKSGDSVAIRARAAQRRRGGDPARSRPG